MTKVIYGIIGLIVVGGVIFFFLNGDNSDQNVNNTISTNQVSGNTIVIKSTNQPIAVNAEPPPATTNSNSDSVVQTAGKYIDYSESNYDSNKGSKRILYFHAGWCPTCIIANRDFENNADEIPAGVVILKTDYDTETALKNKYGITYQHTFVQVDEQGEEITKWNGGGLNQLIKKVR